MAFASSPARRTISIGLGLTLASLGAVAVMAQAPRPRARTTAARPVPTPTATPAPTARPTAKPTAAPSLSINHEEMGCVVVGQFPQFKACFAPASDLAKAEMYFRADKSPAWYRVLFAADGTCQKATLPKPTKALLGTQLFAYASGTSRQWGEARTREYALQVVESESQCKSDKPVAPWVPSATVTVFPSLPAGFVAAGGGGLPVLAIVGGGTALAGGGVFVAASSGGDDGPSDTPTATPTPTPVPPVVGPTPTPTPTVGPNLPPNLNCRVSPDPARGTFPFDVEFNLCRTEDPEGAPLTFTFDFGDGGRAAGFCRETHTYSRAGTFGVTMCASDGTTERCCTASVTADAPVTPKPTYPLGWIDRLNVASILTVRGATGQVVMDGKQVAYPGEGVAHLITSSRRGEIRFEGQIVSAEGRPGRWEFDLSQTDPMIPGTLRALSGQVLEVTSDSIVFAMRGKAGERVSFTFETWR